MGVAGGGGGMGAQETQTEGNRGSLRNRERGSARD